MVVYDKVIGYRDELIEFLKQSIDYVKATAHVEEDEYKEALIEDFEGTILVLNDMADNIYYALYEHPMTIGYMIDKDTHYLVVGRENDPHDEHGVGFSEKDDCDTILGEREYVIYNLPEQYKFNIGDEISIYNAEGDYFEGDIIGFNTNNDPIVREW